MGFAIEIGGLGRFADEGPDILHEHGIQTALRGKRRRQPRSPAPESPRRAKTARRPGCAAARRRAPARRAARSDCAASSPISTSKVRMISASPPEIAITTNGVGMTGVKPAKDDEGRQRQKQRGRRPPKARIVPPSGLLRTDARFPRLSAGLDCSRAAQSSPCAMSVIANRELRLCNDVARLRQNGGRFAEESLTRSRDQRIVRIVRKSRSRIFLRRVLRLSPSTSAALIWLPRVVASVAAISGASSSRSRR